MTRRQLMLAVLTLLMPPVVSLAQTGFPPFGSIDRLRFDARNNQSMNKNFALPVVSSSGRGIDLNVALVYNSVNWAPLVGAWSFVTPGNLGWLYGSPAGQITYQVSHGQSVCLRSPDGNLYVHHTNYTNYKYTDAFGTQHFLGLSWHEDISDCDGSDVISGTFTNHLTDGSGLYASIPSGSPDSPSVTTRNGVVITNSTVTDTNGNYISSSSPVSGETDWTDSVGRIALKIITGATSIQYKYLDTTGVYQTTTLNLQTFNVKTNFACSGLIEYSGTYSLPVSLVLPDNQTYQFSYEPTPSFAGYYTGRLQRITLPTGGYHEYDYVGANDGINCADGTTLRMNRIVSDGTNSATWTHVRNTSTLTTTITNPLLPDTTSANDDVITFNSSGQEISRKIYANSPGTTLLRTINTTWAANGTPATRVTILENGSTQSEVDTTYDSNGILGVASEYDWGSGARGSLLRTTTLTYQASSNYTSRNMLNLLTSKVIKDGAGTIRYRQDVTYDGVALTSANCPAGAPHHNDAGYPCTFNYRGNPTTVMTYLTPATPANPIANNLTYDWFGNTRTIQDALNNTTTLAYSPDAWGNTACPPSTTTYAYPVSVSNALSQITSFSYFACTGQLASVKDPNTQTTSFTYDSLLRPTVTNFPDGGQTTVAYNSPISITSTTKMNSTQNIVSTTLLDGLGRTKQTQLGDPQGVDYTDTVYDSLGRLASGSNPYRSTSDATYGITSYQYDVLGRPTLVIPPDGSSSANNISATYSTNTTTVTDQAGKKRKSTVDGIGRPTQITEDPGGLGYITTYMYDALNNLTNVTQNGSRSRTFGYDALSRLTSQTNPESGTTNYYFTTSVGALCSGSAMQVCRRTDARSITTTYAFDALNRLTQKSYSDGTTPAAYYFFDLINPWGTNYPNNYIGRLSETETGNLITSSYFHYDPMGRVLTKAQCTPVNCTTPGTTGFHTNYSYDLLGNVTSFGTSENGITFSYQYDSASRPTTVTSSLIDAQHPATLATVNAYMPSGSPSFVTYGNGVGEIHLLNSTLQFCRLNVNTGGTPLPLTTHCPDNLPYPTLQDFYLTYNEGTSNNGNVAMFQGTYGQTFHRYLGYDSLNRLSAMSEGFTNPACKGLTWTYDAWGNRTDQTQTAGTCNIFHASVNTNNQLTDPINNKYQYDAAGNMIHDASHSYTYDAENRLISVDAGSTANYTYDAEGNRVEKVVSSVITQYVPDPGGQVVLETDGTGNGGPVADYIYLAGKLVAEYKNNTTYFVHSDHLGSTRVLTALNKSVFDSIDYLPFGEQIAGGSGTSHKFTEDERDSESNLDHTLFRQYSSSLGRWMHPDPAGLAAVDPANPQSWNRYAYVLNDPLDYVDPFGLCPWCNPSQYPSTSACRTPQAQCPHQPAGSGLTDPFAFAYGGMGLALFVLCPNDDCVRNPNFAWLLLGAGLDNSGFLSRLKKKVQAACRAFNPPDVITAGGGVDAGFIGTAGEQLGLAANGNSGQLSLVNTANLDVGMISLDAYGYVGSIPRVASNSQLGGGFSSLTNLTNHVNMAGQRTGISVGLDDHSKTYTLGASALPFTASFGTSRSAVLFTIPYAGYALNPFRAVCKAAGD